MKLIIDNAGVKRRFEGSFSICGSQADLLHLSKVIAKHLEEKNINYGWIDILVPIERSLPDTEPLSWTDPVGDPKSPVHSVV